MTLTEIGATVGFLTGVYILFDRFMKGWPIAYLVASGPVSNAILSLRIKNVGQQDLVLKRLLSFPRFYEIAKDDNPLGIIEAHLKSFIAVLPPGQEIDFPVPVFASTLGEASRGPCVFVISWRRATNTWLPQIPVCLFTSRHTADQFKGAYRPNS